MILPQATAYIMSGLAAPPPRITHTETGSHMHVYTHTHAHARTHAHTHACTHAQ